jgi:peptidoglycan/xylan/chitin deacetylase (PgdA/CDA1 family)
MASRPGLRGGAALLLALMLAGCGTPTVAPLPPPVPVAAPVAPPDPPPVGQVLGRNERFVIYQPVAGDTLRSIAERFLGGASNDWIIRDFNGILEARPEQPLVVPLGHPNPVGVRAGQVQTVPILCYHRFGAGSGASASKMVVSAGNFAAQLDWLARNDYHVLPLSRLQGFLEGRQPLPQRSVVITIDDGYESVHRHALPLLRRYGFPATLFAYTDFIGASDALSWAQLKELVASGLVDVQAHSKSHRNLIERNAGETEAQHRQMLELETRAPRELLERRLDVRISQFAYPYGDSSQAVLDMLVSQRYQMGLTVIPGSNAFYAQPLMLRRTMIYGDLDLAGFKAKLQTTRAYVAP